MKINFGTVLIDTERVAKIQKGLFAGMETIWFDTEPVMFRSGTERDLVFDTISKRYVSVSDLVTPPGKETA